MRIFILNNVKLTLKMTEQHNRHCLLLMSEESRHLEDTIILQMNSQTLFIQMEKEAEKQHQAIPSRDDEENCVCK